MLRLAAARSARRPTSRLEVAGAVYDWVTCVFVAVMVGSQFFGVISSSVDSVTHAEIGRDPVLGPYSTQKTNDVPFTDRVLACAVSGSGFTPTLVSDLLESPTVFVSIEDTTGASVAGYRLVERRGAELDSVPFSSYQHTCQTLSSTMSGILSTCKALGYNVSTDGLRVVNGVHSSATVLISNALPVLVMPYMDNAVDARYAVPGVDGSACIFRVTGKFTNAAKPTGQIHGLDRSVREEKTAEWLRQPRGRWRNGWFEDADGDKWYSDMVLAGSLLRSFDAESGRELNCSQPGECEANVQVARWGPHFVIETTVLPSTSVVVFNGTQFGFFWFKGAASVSLTSDYTWEMALANVSIALLIFRWIVSLVALHRGYLAGHCALHHTGIGALSNSTGFMFLPMTLLPRLTTTLAAFFSAGCHFQGQQRAFTETWFVMYPSLTELSLLYYSLLNSLAKVLRRRVSDALFAPTIIALSALHWCRQDIARSQWMHLADGFVSTLVTTDDMKRLRLRDFFTSDVALRLNGRVTSLFVLKLAVLGVSLVPLLLARPLPVHKQLAKSLQGAEEALGMRASNVAGLGRPQVYETRSDATGTIRSFGLFVKRGSVQPEGILALSSYELVRLGYVVFGDKFLISTDDWDRVSMLVGFREFYHLWNHRVVVFTLYPAVSGSPGLVEVSESPELMRVDAPELRSVSVWKISACSLRCSAEA